MPTTVHELPSELDIPGLGVVNLEPSSSTEHAFYLARDGVTFGSYGSPKVYLSPPRYTPFQPNAFAMHMGQLWAELSTEFDVALPRMRRSVVSAMETVLKLDSAACTSLSETLFHKLRISSIVMYPAEGYWLWRRLPMLIVKEGVVMTWLGLSAGEQCYQIEIDADAITKETGGHDLFITARRHMKSLGANFDG